MWKERIEKILKDNIKSSHANQQDFLSITVIQELLNLAKEVHEKACKDQKEICWKNSSLYRHCHCQLNFIDRHEGSCEIVEGDDKGSDCDHYGENDILFIRKESITECPNAKFE